MTALAHASPVTRLEPERFQFTSADGLPIACVKWSGCHPIRGVVQIAHGLGEHIGRYAELAETLVPDNLRFTATIIVAMA